ncbi:MAG: hypothetical protein M3Y21_05630 [Candidatus Eremiobacteraeota bacterium]|nr:hypothetical protein [Candidatus Eremiobacteraeota bacterium]
MHLELFGQHLVIFVFAALVVVLYGGGWGTREQRVVAAPIALLIAVLVAFGIAAPVIAYALLCLTMTGAYLFREERARSRRVASLAPRPAVDVVPTIWIVTAAASSILVTPYVVFAEQQVAAIVVALCALVMAAVAWRIATAPIQLAGKDIQSERLHDRVWRFRRVGITAVVAVGSIFVFTSFANAGLPSTLAAIPVFYLAHLASFVVWIGLALWYAYVKLRDRSSCASAL